MARTRPYNHPRAQYGKISQKFVKGARRVVKSAFFKRGAKAFGKIAGGKMAIVPGGGYNQKSIRIAYKKSKQLKFWKVISPVMISKASAGATFLSTQGRQGANILFQSDSAAIIAALGTVDYYHNTALATAVGNPVTPTTAGYSHQNIIYDSLGVKMKLQNQSSVQTEVDFYLFMQKNSDSAAYVTPITYWTAGYTNTVGVGTAGATNLVGCFPKESKDLNMHFKCVRKWQTVLTAGAQYNIYFRFHPNRILDLQYLSSFTGIKGLSWSIMMVQRGQIGDVTISGGASTIGIAQTKIIAELDVEYRFRFLTPWSKLIYRSTDTYPTNPANLYIMKGESDEIVDTGTAAVAAVAGAHGVLEAFA